MIDADLAPLIGYYVGSFALGWTAGITYLAFRKFVEGAT